MATATETRYWLLQDFDAGDGHGLVFTAEHLAMHAAEKIVGNRSPAFVGGSEGMLLYGPGDGTTRVMIRAFDGSMIQKMGFNLPV